AKLSAEVVKLKGEQREVRDKCKQAIASAPIKIGSLSRRHAHWTPSAVAKLLLNRAVLGELTTLDGVTYPGFYPAAITEQQWYDVRNARGGRKVGAPGRNRGEAHNLFTSLLFNAPDGQRLYRHAYPDTEGRRHMALISAGLKVPGEEFSVMP